MKKYHIITIGCQMNISDSERIAGYLDSFGFKSTDDKNNADVVIIVTCGVRQSAEDRIYGLIPDIKNKNLKCTVILTGCLSERKDVKSRLNKYVDIWLPMRDIRRLDFLLYKNNKNRKSVNSICNLKNKNLKNNPKSYLSVKPKYSSNISAFVPIGNGCNNFCSYCVVPLARGREAYRPAEEIINEVKELIKKDYKEIFLIAQNVNSYKSKDRNIDFADLLNSINNIPGNFWVRFATSHPKDMTDKLIKTISRCKKVCQHIHLPVQAGDDEILKKMNQNYTVEHYKKLIGKIRKLMPEVSISTDVIVGFPSETKLQFNKTKKLFKEIKFDMAYLAQYSSRPGTAAEKMKDNVPSGEKKRREEILNDILKKTALEYNKKYIGKTIRILVDTFNKTEEHFGRTETNKNVKINKSALTAKNLLGRFAYVKITQVTNFSMQGDFINYEK